MILSCQNISKSFGTDEILKNVSFHIEENEKAAVVGINGAGKSTLLKIIMKQENPDEGEVTLAKDKTIGYLAQNQEIVLPRDSIMEHIWHANCEIESRTLDVHIKTLRHKLGEAGKYIKTVRNVGYCMNLV